MVGLRITVRQQKLSLESCGVFFRNIAPNISSYFIKTNNLGFFTEYVALDSISSLYMASVTVGAR